MARALPAAALSNDFVRLRLQLYKQGAGNVKTEAKQSWIGY